ncbi:MAG: hypothetical protein EPO32_02905 [Anaerolineae bacterium]|nr:MAG: hypothetical protein EPO32_02905 [Anaerolineae bacterium]
MKRILLALFLTLFLAACGPAETPLPDGPLPTDLFAGGTLEVPLGETHYLQDGSAIEFLEVVEESRCPANAMCVRAGKVQIRVAMSYGTEVIPMTLTLGELDEGDASVYTHADFTVTLQSVEPYPGTGESDATPIATLVVEATGQ